MTRPNPTVNVSTSTVDVPLTVATVFDIRVSINGKARSPCRIPETRNQKPVRNDMKKESVGLTFDGMKVVLVADARPSDTKYATRDLRSDDATDNIRNLADLLVHPLFSPFAILSDYCHAMMHGRTTDAEVLATTLRNVALKMERDAINATLPADGVYAFSDKTYLVARTKRGLRAYVAESFGDGCFLATDPVRGIDPEEIARKGKSIPAKRIARAAK